MIEANARIDHTELTRAGWIVGMHTSAGSDCGFGLPLSCDTVQSMLDVADVKRWENLKGKPVRVRCDESGRVVAVGHYLNDYWLEAKEEAN